MVSFPTWHCPRTRRTWEWTYHASQRCKRFPRMHPRRTYNPSAHTRAFIEVLTPHTRSRRRVLDTQIWRARRFARDIRNDENGTRGHNTEPFITRLWSLFYDRCIYASWNNAGISYVSSARLFIRLQFYEK